MRQNQLDAVSEPVLPTKANELIGPHLITYPDFCRSPRTMLAWSEEDHAPSNEVELRHVAANTRDFGARPAKPDLRRERQVSARQRVEMTTSAPFRAISPAGAPRLRSLPPRHERRCHKRHGR
jgi:hypothetical protein